MTHALSCKRWSNAIPLELTLYVNLQFEIGDMVYGV